MTAIYTHNPLTSTARHKILLQVCIAAEKYLIRKILEKGKPLHKTKYRKPEITGEEKLIEHG
ncbi:MAG TPA: hypothetical protein O0X21_02210 [Methanocorpusculum sp.]|nr:hypothetical protein [Methanocorpusculum sp.]HJJ61988.1 hypothetical protein [Methanocorpusculum sp.]HJJ63197.1 hypothetical protein [Methanocorpusculum sp.]HJJ68973.1 hypothetical protein [Methanocorpusculum sp.]HJJ70766.1 hypothetical protein [Methanocorpusculum sp.]